MSVLEDGYVIPFVEEPPSCYLKNNASALNDSEFVVQAITALLEANCASECVDVPYCCNPLTVVVGKKKRLVIDLSRSVNPYLKHDKFKYDNLVTLSEMFKVGYWFFTFDIESGYHHIDIHPSSRKFLGFSFVWPDGRVRYFVFNVLPFGLSSACYVFTKMFRPFVRRWREFGQAALMYIDDGISSDAQKHVACNNSMLVQSDLRSSGWKPAQSKCYWEPRQIGEWLGLQYPIHVCVRFF